MSEQFKLKVTSAIEKVPSLPLTALKIVKLANDINSPPKDMLDTIKMDPMITGKVLKLINSSYFGLSQQVTDLRQALVMLGANTVKNIALASALLSTMRSGSGSAGGLDQDALWLRSLATACGAKLAAKNAGVPRAQIEEYFLLGLLHDCGRIFCFQMLAQEYLAVLIKAQKEQIPLASAEMEEFGMRSAQIGGLLAERWQLPANIHDAILYHENPLDSQAHAREVAIVTVARHLVQTLNLGWNDGLLVPPLSTDLISKSGVDFDRLRGDFSVIRDEIEKAKMFIQR
ncbi:MAG: hypothetical protein RL095_350 [Verrucomicrobiota bacterium]|jgi:HD-like signal output (HDOD) protein